MAMKRKRSSVTIASPSYDGSDTSHVTPNSTAIPSFYPHSKPIEALHQKPTWSFPIYDEHSSSPHLNSRTRKRHRDDRPDDEQVYASTINRLFEAQRHLSHVDANNPESDAVASPPPERPQKTTLHSFWPIPQSKHPTTTTTPGPGPNLKRHMNVERKDCLGTLRDEGDMELDDIASMTMDCRQRP